MRQCLRFLICSFLIFQLLPVRLFQISFRRQKIPVVHSSLALDRLVVFLGSMLLVVARVEVARFLELEAVALGVFLGLELEAVEMAVALVLLKVASLRELFEFPGEPQHF